MKKLMLGLVPLFAVAAFAVMPAMASAATTAYGTCEPTSAATETHPPCPEGEKNFVAFPNGTSVKVVSEKTLGGKNFILEVVKTKAKIECEDLKDVGTFENIAGVGNSKETLIFTHCFTLFETKKCRVNTTKAGAGLIVGTVTDKVLTETTVQITVTGGFAIKFSGSPTGCPPTGTAIGTVKGKTTGTQATGSNDLVFSAATGLELEAEPATLTGNDETYTEEGEPVVIN